MSSIDIVPFLVDVLGVEHLTMEARCQVLLALG
jgi:hypothetical protein